MRYTLLALLCTAVVLLTGCAGFQDFVTQAGAQDLVNLTVATAVGEVTNGLSPEQTVLVTDLVAAQTDPLSGTKLGVNGGLVAAGMTALHWWRNSQRTKRGEPTGAAPVKV